MTSSAAPRWRRSWRAARPGRSVTSTSPPSPAHPPRGAGGEPIWHDGAVVGWITSGAYAHYSGRSLAFGYVPTELAVPGETFEVEIIGQRRPARLLAEPVFDPAGQRMRA